MSGPHNCKQVTFCLEAVSQKWVSSHKMPFLPSLLGHQGTISLSSCLIPQPPSAKSPPPSLPESTAFGSHPASVCLQATAFSVLCLLTHVSAAPCCLGSTKQHQGTTPGPGIQDKSIANFPQPDDEVGEARHGEALLLSQHLWD